MDRAKCYQAKNTAAKRAAKRAFWDAIDKRIRIIVDPSGMDLDELAGFFDGDGSFYFTGQRHISCAVTQCSYETLRKIQDRFGGIIRKRDPKKEHERRKNQRFQYTLVFRGLQVVGIVSFIKDRLIRKRYAANRVMNLIRYYNETTQEAANARKTILEAAVPVADYGAVNWSYIRGLFEAEGCLRFDKFCIAQKDDLKLLHAIKAFADRELNADLGKVNTTSWIITKQAHIRLVVDKLWDPGMFHDEKADQIQAFHDGDRQLITHLKHVEEDAPDSVIVEGNERAKELVQKIREAWHSSFTSRADRPAMHRQPKRFRERVPPLTLEKMASILSLRGDGLSLSQIATRIDSTKSQVTNYLKSLGK